MDVKTFIAAPESGLTSLGISILDTRGRELLTLAEQLTELKSCLKEAKKKQGRGCASVQDTGAIIRSARTFDCRYAVGIC